MTKIKERLHTAVVCTLGKTGQFDILADGEKIAERGGNWFTRRLGAGYPDLDSVVARLVEKQRSKQGGS